MTEKLRREDVEACPSPEPIEFSRSSRRRQWRAAFLLASALAATAVVFAAIGLVTGLGVVRSGESLGDGCSVSAGDEPAVSGDVTAPENTKVEPQQLSATKCPLHPSPSPLPSPLPEKIVAAISTLETQLETLLNDQTMPGLVASVTYREEDIWSKGFGVTRKRVAGKTPDKDTIYRIASVSKIFVVLMVYQMYDRGLIRSLDDPLNYFCPTFHINNPFTADNITLRQIMSSMSGLPREAPCGQPEEPSVNLCPHNTSAILGRLSKQSTILPPWTQPSYSNLGFALLGRCLVSHFFPETSYEDYLQLHILDPLGMAGTGFTYSSHSVLGRLATGYESDGSAEPLYDVGWWGPAGQMHSTASDLNKLGRFFYSTGETDNPVYSSVLSASLRRLMLLPTYTNRDLLSGIGTPWEVSYQNDYTLIMKGGNLRGYSAVFSIVPDLQLGLNILFSGMVSKLGVAKLLHSSLIPALVGSLAAPATYPLPPNTTAYTGVYTAERGSGALAIANVHLYEGSLALSGSAFRGIYLAYREPCRFQIEFSDHELSCLSTELLALRHTWIYFDQSGYDSHNWQADSFTMPGFSPGLHFKRI